MLIWQTYHRYRRWYGPRKGATSIVLIYVSPDTSHMASDTEDGISLPSPAEDKSSNDDRVKIGEKPLLLVHEYRSHRLLAVVLDKWLVGYYAVD